MNELELSSDALKAVDIILIATLARGDTVEAAASIAGVSARTVYRRLTNPEFVARVAELRANMFTTITSRLLDSLPNAMTTLESLLSNADKDMQFKAAVKLIELAFKTREDVERDRDVKLQVFARDSDEQQAGDVQSPKDSG
jgi:hypothetical protein